MIEEQWAVIEGFPDYAVSNLGQVKSLRFDKILKPRINGYGHHRVVLYHEGKPHDIAVHRLVAATFIGGFSSDLSVKPRDGDHSNLSVMNLRFRQGQRMGTLNRNISEPAVRRLMIVETNEIFDSVSQCAEHFGGDPSAIYRVLRGERPHHLGFTFQYVKEH
jgi:hypothetical protein